MLVLKFYENFVIFLNFWNIEILIIFLFFLFYKNNI